MALSRDKILHAALELVDTEGLGGLSMRKLGAKLGVEAMSLYRYVQNKSDLLDGVFEVVAAEASLPDPSGDWRADARAASVGLFAALSRHPNALSLFASRPAATPAALLSLERTLLLLEQSGASLEESLRMFNVLFAYILGFAMLQVVPDDATPVDYSSLDAQGFPRLSQLRRILDAADPAQDFERGLDAVIEGLAVQLG